MHTHTYKQGLAKNPSVLDRWLEAREIQLTKLSLGARIYSEKKKRNKAQSKLDEAYLRRHFFQVFIYFHL